MSICVETSSSNSAGARQTQTRQNRGRRGRLRSLPACSRIIARTPFPRSECVVERDERAHYFKPPHRLNYTDQSIGARTYPGIVAQPPEKKQTEGHQEKNVERANQSRAALCVSVSVRRRLNTQTDLLQLTERCWKCSRHGGKQRNFPARRIGSLFRPRKVDSCPGLWMRWVMHTESGEDNRPRPREHSYDAAHVPELVRRRGTPIAVQQKLMRHADIRTTMNVYGDVVTDGMQRPHSKVAGLALSGLQGQLTPLFWRKRVRVERTGDRIPAARRF